MKTRALLALAGLLALPLAQGSTCPTDMPVSVVEVSSFTCTLGNETFSAFNVVGAPVDARIQFGQTGPLFAVSLDRDGAFFTGSRLLFDYAVTVAAPLTIREGSVGVDVSFPLVVTSTSMNGTLLPTLRNGGTDIVVFTPGFSTLLVTNSAVISSSGDLNSITNDFAEQVVGVPEPGTVPLAILGLAGLGWIIWRKR